MREWITICEAFNMSPYGYWVSPNGDIYPVADEQHEAAIYDIENCSYGDAIVYGWVRVVARSGGEYMHMEASSAITDRAIMALSRIAQAGTFSQYVVDFHVEPGDMQSFEMFSWSRVAEKLKDLRQQGSGWSGLSEGREFESKFYPAKLPATPENITAAQAFVFRKWVERFREKYPYTVKSNPESIPADLSNSCKFSSLFARAIFGGRLMGNDAHQFVRLQDGTLIDLNIDASDVKEIADRGDDPHEHDEVFWGHPEHKRSVRSCVPRVKEWVEEFLKEQGDA